jgi:DNA-binding MarR family transcriptional regulator
MHSGKDAGAVPAAGKVAGSVDIVGLLDHVLNKRLRDSLAPLRVTQSQYDALSVFRMFGTLSGARLAEQTMMTPQSANEIVKGLEAKGWIERSPDPGHGRIIRIRLTDKGLARLHACDEAVKSVEERMFPTSPTAKAIGYTRGCGTRSTRLTRARSERTGRHGPGRFLGDVDTPRGRVDKPCSRCRRTGRVFPSLTNPWSTT